MREQCEVVCQHRLDAPGTHQTLLLQGVVGGLAEPRTLIDGVTDDGHFEWLRWPSEVKVLEKDVHCGKR
ncbi:hypothetical protein GCM10025762_07920 [Haloechinothrix salitolerans]